MPDIPVTEFLGRVRLAGFKTLGARIARIEDERAMIRANIRERIDRAIREQKPDPLRLTAIKQTLRELTGGSVPFREGLAINLFIDAIQDGAFAGAQWLGVIAMLRTAPSWPNAVIACAQATQTSMKDWNPNADFLAKGIPLVADLIGAEAKRLSSLPCQEAPGKPSPSRSADAPDAKQSALLKGMATPKELAAERRLPEEATRKALQRWREGHGGGDGYIQNTECRRNEPRFLYDRAVVAHVLDALEDRTTKREIRRTKTSSARPSNRI